LGLTPQELEPILHDQQEFLRNEFAQPPSIITRPTTYHLIPATEQLRLTQEEVEEMLEDQRELIREEEEQEQEVGGHNTPGTQHQHQDQNNSIARPRSAPPLVIHPESAAAQLGLTPEEAKEVHKECTHAQEEIQQEIEAEDRVAHERKAGRNVHEAYNVTNDPDAYTVLFECNSKNSSRAD
jgi:hypothetical protein